MDYNENKILVNGPINVIRVEGKINNIKKVIYLFMDRHDRATRCKDLNAINISQYLAQNFKKAEKKNLRLDVFPEFQMNDANYITRKIGSVEPYYIMDVAQIVPTRADTESGKLYQLQSNRFKTTYFHFIDLREVLSAKERNVLGQLRELSTVQNINQDEIAEYRTKSMKLLEFLSSYYQLLLEIFQQKDVNLNNYQDLFGSSIEIVKKILNKILTKYQHGEVKKKLLSYYLPIIEQRLKKNLELIEEIKKKITGISAFYDKYEQQLVPPEESENKNFELENYLPLETSEGIFWQEFISSFSILVESLTWKSILTHASIMDLYLMRRVLDKDYINNSVCYTGYFHTIYYVDMLIKHFDFKITHIAKNPVSNISKLNNLIKKSPKKNIGKYILYPEYVEHKLIQCVDLTNFPNNFQ